MDIRPRFGGGGTGNMNMNIKQVVSGSNLKWVSLVGICLSFFIYAQSQSRDKGKQEEKIATNTEVIKQLIEADEKAIEFRVQQTAQIAKLETTAENTAEDVKEIKDDNKEMIKLLIEIKNNGGN